MKKIGIYIIIFILVILLRNNIVFFYGNVLGTFKLDNNYYDSIIKLKDEKIDYLTNEINNINEFSKNISKLEYKYMVSKIIYKESYNTDKFLIQYGTNNNISLGLGVTNEYGLIGKITKINKNNSELTTLRNLKDISVSINNVFGKLNYDEETELFTVTDISNYDKVLVNDLVYTSGYGTIKEHLYIGKVIKIENDSISKKIYVKSDVNFNDLNYVLIVGDNFDTSIR